MGLPDTPASVDALRKRIEGGVPRGLRATLKTANLLTGSMLVDVDYHPDEPDAAVGEFAGYPVIPTVSTGIGRLENQVSQLLKKLNDLQLETTLRRLDEVLVSLRDAVDVVKAGVTGEKAQEMTTAANAVLKKLNASLNKFNAALDSVGPDSPTADRLDQALIDFNQTLRNIETLTRKLSDKPNSLIFSPPAGEDPMPKQGGSR
jgi:paraquat-inducible protein B